MTSSPLTFRFFFMSRPVMLVLLLTTALAATPAAAIYDHLPGPDDVRSNACSRAYDALTDQGQDACHNDASIATARSSNPTCPAPCQALLDAVDGNCTAGETPYILARNVDILYQPAVLYNELTTTNVWPVTRNCNFYYSPTACDDAINALSFARFAPDRKIGPPVEASGSVCEKSQNTVCTPECQQWMDAVVAACDVPAATFAPSSGYGSQTHQVVEWKFPIAMEFMGFNPNLLDVAGTLSMSCWDYYETQVAAQTRAALETSSSEPGSAAVGSGLRMLLLLLLGGLLSAVQ